MKKSCLIFVLFLLSLQLFADDDDEKFKLAVTEFEDLSGEIQPEVLANATEYLRVGFASTNRYIIISKERQREQISDLRKKFNTDPSYKSCTDKNCQIQLGQALSADLIVKTTVSAFAGVYTISSELIDLEKEATIIAAKEDYDGSQQALRTAIDKLVVKIVDAEKEKEALAAQEKKEKKALPKNKDGMACEYARNEASDLGWKVYLEKYPNGECAAEAKEELDDIACKKAEKLNSDKGWNEYLNEFPDGKCEFKARTTLKKSDAVQEQAKAEQAALYSKADEKLEGGLGKFSGRWNMGLGFGFFTPNHIGFQTGADFNFKVFEKPYGSGAGNLFVGLGIDFKYWLKTESDGIDHREDYYENFGAENNLVNIPVQVNIGYEFKIKNPTLRYVGIWASFGMSVDIDVCKDSDYPDNFYYDDDNTLVDVHYSKFDETFLQLSFAWDIAMNMIFKNGMLLNIGFGGNHSKRDALMGKAVYYRHYDEYEDKVKITDKIWDLDNIYLTIGTGVIF